MSERIDHATEAHEYEKEACGAQRIGEESAEAMATLSLMKATLALVEQARIANLIKLGSLTAWESDLPGHPIEHLAFAAIGDPDSGELRPEIREALGI